MSRRFPKPTVARSAATNISALRALRQERVRLLQLHKTAKGSDRRDIVAQLIANEERVMECLGWID